MTTENTVNYTVHNIPMKEIFSDPDFNCRGYIAPIDVTELSKDIKVNGLQSPIIVQKYSNPTHPEYKYRIVAGHRRHKAFMINEAIEIPAFIRDGLSELSARILNLTENINRKCLNIVEEAKSLKAIKDLGMTQEDTAKILNATRGWVQVRFMLLELPTEIQQEAKAETINQQTIRDLYTLKKQNKSDDELFEFVRKYKHARISGEKIVVRASSKSRGSTKRIRQRGEVFKLQDIISKNFGNGLTTRALAWVAGEISDAELIVTMKAMAEENKITLELPDEETIV
jgi:ParB/RepB/Spo0J family partition protein